MREAHTLSILQETLRQAGRPQGWLGRSIVRGMNSGHSRLASWGLGLVNIARDLDVLDIGCGGGGTVRRLAGMATEGNVIGIDYSPDAVFKGWFVTRCRLVRCVV